MNIILTKHAKERMKKRGILDFEIIEALNKPSQIKRKNGKIFFSKIIERGTIEVCTIKKENNIKILTIYWL